MMMTFMEVKGQQRSNTVNFDGYETWSEEPLMQAEDDDLNGGQRGQ